MRWLLVTVPLVGLYAQNPVMPASVFAVEHEKIPLMCRYRTAEDFTPLTTAERLTGAGYAFAGPSTLVYTAIRAGINQAWHRPREWKQDPAGLGWRSGSIYAEQVIGETFEQSVSYMRHEDNRYFVSGEHNFVRRLGYALASTVLARHDDGHRGLSFSVIGGAATGAFISRAWQPRSTTTAGDAAVSIGLVMATRAGLNIVREFSPRFAARILQ